MARSKCSYIIIITIIVVVVVVVVVVDVVVIVMLSSLFPGAMRARLKVTEPDAVFFVSKGSYNQGSVVCLLSVQRFLSSGFVVCLRSVSSFFLLFVEPFIYCSRRY